MGATKCGSQLGIWCRRVSESLNSQAALKPHHPHPPFVFWLQRIIMKEMLQRLKLGIQHLGAKGLEEYTLYFLSLENPRVC